MDNKFERVEDTHPNRCHGIIPEGQCHYKAVEGCQFCLMHGGGKQASVNKANQLKNYRLQQYQERVGELSNNPEIKNLREEIGIIRMLLESILNLCKNANQLLLYTDKIAALADQVRKLIESAQRLEERNNNLLDRKVVILIADSIVTIIGQYVDDPDVLNSI